MVWGTAGIQLQRQRFPQWDTLNCMGGGGEEKIKEKKSTISRILSSISSEIELVRPGQMENCYWMNYY